MPGSAADPVVLDPFRTITEVGWNDIPEYIAVAVLLEASGTGVAGAVCSYPPFDDWPYLGAAHETETYLSDYELTNKLTSGKPYSTGATGYWKTHTKALAVDSGDHPVTISGTPTGPFISQSFGAWAYCQAALSGDGGYGIRFTGLPASPYSDPEYGGLPSDMYQTLARPMEMIAHEITGDGQCGWTPMGGQPLETAPVNCTGADPDPDVFFSTAITVGSGTVDVSGLSVSYRGASFTPVAVSGDAGNQYIIGDGFFTVAVLCKRST